MSASTNHAAVLGPGRMGRQIALAFALGGSRVFLVDAKDRPAGGAAAVFADARRDIRRHLALMAEAGVIAAAVVERTVAFLEKLGKIPVRCADSPGFIVPRMQALLMNEAVRLVEEGVATPEDVDRAFRAGMGFRYATVGIFEFIDWGGVDILHRASGFLAEALGDDRFRPARLVEEKIARNELGPKTGRGFFDYTGDRREAFETAKIRALLRQLKRAREDAPRH